MKSLFVVFLLAIPGLIFAQTSVSGNQTGSWTAAGSPYLVTGEVVVPSGQTLTIEPGVEVNFQGHHKLLVNGSLQAIGSENDLILFTTDNTSIGWGGIQIESSVNSTLSFCRIEFGKTGGEYPDIHGGGMRLMTSDAAVSNCIFADNDATGESNGMGGAIYAINTSETTFTDCQFLRNYAYGEGGAIKFSADSNTQFDGCKFVDNNCLYGGGAISGYGLYGTQISNSVFHGNYTMYSNGGALNTLGSGNTLFFANCTFFDNTAVHGDGGAMSLDYGTTYFANCIIYQNDGAYSDDVYVGWGADAEVHYCNMAIPDGATGTFNINQDPQFQDAAGGDFRLHAFSPSVDTGTDHIILGGRVLVNLESGEYYGSAPDMGALEHWDVSAAGDDALTVFRLEQNYPNPFISRTAISYSLSRDSYVTATVYNVRGQEIRNLISSDQAAGQNTVSWNGTNNAGRRMSQGIYFLRLKAGNDVSSVRMLLTN